MGRNPATGEAIKIPAKTVVRMRVAKAAKDAIVPGRKQGRKDLSSRKNTYKMNRRSTRREYLANQNWEQKQSP